MIRPALSLLIIFTIVTGLIYPGLVTITAQTLFRWQADGSMVKYKEKIVGSHLIGQDFHSSKYFWGRPSATKDFAYNSLKSSGSNLGPANPELIKIVKERVKKNLVANPNTKLKLPIELVTASASGLDPHISLHAAYYQVSRISKSRKISEDKIIEIVDKHPAKYLNVLQLNLELDQLQND